MSIIIILNLIYVNSNAKYLIEEQFCIANVNIDVTKPKIQISNVQNKSDEVIINVKIIEKNIKNIYFNNEFIKIKKDNNYIDTTNIEIDENIHQIKLKVINENKNIEVEFLEGMVVDMSELMNEYIEIEL